MTQIDFFDAYEKGQRHFSNLDFEDVEEFSNKNFSNITFENCFLHVDFRHSNLTNAKFINCNIKEIDLRECNLTNAVMTNCLVECALFKNSILNGFKFIDNYYYGLTIGQKEFEENIINSDAYISTKKLTEHEYKQTLGLRMNDVTETAASVVDIWSYVNDLVHENVVSNYVLKNFLVEKVYRDYKNSYEHILLPTSDENFFIVVVINLKQLNIVGHYRLNLNKEYSLR